MTIQQTIEKGVYVAALTPLRSNLRCHDAVLAKHCLNLLERGCQGVVVFGTTGEGASFSVKEKIKTIRSIIARGVNPRKLIVGNGAACLQDTIDLTVATTKLGCLASLICPPCFYKQVTEEGIIAFYREVIQRVDDPRLKILLYHIPQLSGVPITVPILKKLSDEFPNNVIGIKESEGNMSLIQAILQAIPHTQLFVGKEMLLPQALACGGSGTICGIGNLWPELVRTLYEKGECPELSRRVEAIGQYPFVPFCKALMDKNQYRNWNQVRPPLSPLSTHESETIKKYLSQIS